METAELGPMPQQFYKRLEIFFRRRLGFYLSKLLVLHQSPFTFVIFDIILMEGSYLLSPNCLQSSSKLENKRKNTSCFVVFMLFFQDFTNKTTEKETNKLQLFYQLVNDLLMIALKCHQCHNLETSDCYKIDERKITSFLKECPPNTLACAFRLIMIQNLAGIPEIFRECADNSWLCDAHPSNMKDQKGAVHCWLQKPDRKINTQRYQ
uniref:Uncharacterized protein n=1 Tax=Glossina pallidipes TaxID=7398 RepID=A0A1B0A3L4_GLOPL